jgi:hypothetical protein
MKSDATGEVTRLSEAAMRLAAAQMLELLSGFEPARLLVKFDFELRFYF